jgi:MFS transporter, CP family, cyanate transporter
MRMTLLVMPPVIPQVHDELRMSETQVGLLIGLPLAMLAAAAIPGSLLIARVGATLAVTLGMTIAAIGAAARAAAIDVWTRYAAAIVSGFGVAIMQPGMPTLVREWLPSRLALGTIGYSSGMLIGAMFPAVFTIAFILPAVGGSWRLDVVLWAVPALLIAPVFLFIAGAVSMTAILALPPFLSLPADVPRTAAGMFTISYTCAIIIPTICGALWI